jgi:hypothetical protein
MDLLTTAEPDILLNREESPDDMVGEGEWERRRGDGWY